MMPGLKGFKDVNGFVWPECDIDAAAVVCSQVLDVEVALRYVKAFNICVQAGGNMGVWPKYLSRIFRLVYTFEPEPLNYQALVYNCPESNIIKHEAALGEWFSSHGLHMIYPEGKQNMGACAVMPDGDVVVMRIDDLVLQACDLIQLDVEGYEAHVIMGAEETIYKYKPVL